MAYSPISVSVRDTTSAKTSMMATKGINNRTFSRFLDPEFAQSMKNYLMVEEGKLEKRPGLEDQGVLSGGDAMEMSVKYLDNLYIQGYGTTVSIYDRSAGTNTTLKTDFSSAGRFRGVKYGDYFFVTNGVDTPQRIYRQLTADLSYVNTGTNYLTYSSQTVDFTVGQIVTGTNSGARGTITADSDDGVTGVLTITDLDSVPFEPGEPLSGGAGGAATLSTVNALAVGDRVQGQTSNALATVLEITNPGQDSQVIVLGAVDGTLQNGEDILALGDLPGRSTLTSALTAQISSTNIPKCRNLAVWGNRMVAVGLLTDESACQYSDVDDGSNPPFNSWTEGTAATAGGKIYFRNGGRYNFALVLGDWVVVFQDKGKFAFTTNTLDSGGTISKYEETAMTRIDFGGSDGIMTPYGAFYVNEAGLWNLVSVGQNDVPFSDQEALTSETLGFNYFDDINFSNAALVHDARRSYLYIACGKGSDTNNHVIAYNLKTKSFQEFTNWNISTFLNDDQTIYAGSAVATKFFEVTGAEDDGEPIPTEFIQEINLGDLNTRNKLDRFDIEGALSEGSEIEIDFDIYDAMGCYEASKVNATFTAQCLAVGGDGFDADPFAGHFDGDSTDSEGLVNATGQINPKIANFTRLIIRLTSNDRLPHIIYWFRCEGRIKAKTRKARSAITRN